MHVRRRWNEAGVVAFGLLTGCGSGDAIAGADGGETGTCGNGIVDGAEQCDGDDPVELTCADLGFDQGKEVRCDATCRYDRSACAYSLQSIDAGGSLTCGIRMNGSVGCWGCEATPPSGTFSQVSAGGRHACGVKTDGTVVCWGYDAAGQATPPSGTFSQVSAGEAHTCGVKTDGTVVCWGYAYGTPPSGTFSQVSAGSQHSCGVTTDGSVACWGDNLFFENDETGVWDSTCSQATPPSGTFSHVSAGAAHTCGVRTDGTLMCWGCNSDGQVLPPTGTTFSRLSAWGTDGILTCWGCDSSGGTSPETDTFLQVSAGGILTCGQRADSTWICWGAIGGLEGAFLEVSAGDRHGCALKTDRTATCWGTNSCGQATPPGSARD
ncbi:MAG: hypothetical protein JW940_37705 [Polyangiaceae bacterium]|nr:hypothetical protein [Polyangiaceae bacterium]